MQILHTVQKREREREVGKWVPNRFSDDEDFEMAIEMQRLAESDASAIASEKKSGVFSWQLKMKARVSGV